MSALFARLYNKFFGAPAVEHALAIFQKAVNKLEQVASHHDNVAATQAEAANTARAAQLTASAEALKARNVAAKITALVA